MSSKTAWFLVAFLFLTLPDAPALERSGIIGADETWRLADSPVTVGGVLQVSRSATLTIEPGVVVAFRPGAALVVNGRLVARGTESDSIRFTAQGSGQPGAWAGIRIEGAIEEETRYQEKAALPESEMLYCVLEYAGGTGTEVGAALEIMAASPHLAHSTVRWCMGRVGTVKCSNLSKPTIEDCRVESNRAERGGGVSAGLGSHPILRRNLIAFNESTDEGGGIYVSLANIELEDNLLLGNRAQGPGGAIYAAVSSAFTLRRNYFAGNSSRHGSHNLYFTKRVDAVVKDNVFDSGDSTAVFIYLDQAENDIDATENWWGNPETFSFKDAIRDRYDNAAEPYVRYVPFLWAPPETHPANPRRVDSIVLCRTDAYDEVLPRGVAEGAALRVKVIAQDVDPHYADLIQVRVTSESDPAGIVIPLRETAPHSGLFIGKGKVERTSEQERFTIGSREGGRVTLAAPFQPDLAAEYPTLSPRPYAENLNIALNPGEEAQHLTHHQPRFTWGYFDVLDVPQHGFQLQVFAKDAASPYWDAGVIDRNVQELVYAGPELRDGQTYQARLKVRNDRFWSDEAGFEFRMNSLPTVPEIASPVPDELAPTLNPTLVALPSTDGEGDSLTYRFEVETLDGATAVASLRDVVPQDGRVVWTLPNPLNENAGYRFCVQAWDGWEWGEPSPWRTFFVNFHEEPPAPFALKSHTDGASEYRLHPTLVWEAALDPDPRSNVVYRLQIGTNPDLPPLRTYDGITVTEFTLPDSLDNRTEYVWSVTAVDNTGRTTISSGAGRFYVDTTPSQPVLSAPLAGEERTPSDRLAWKPSTDPNPEDRVLYTLDVYDSPDLTSRTLALGDWPDTSVALTQIPDWENLADNHVYYWTIWARDNHNARTSPSSAGRFFFNRYNDPPSMVPAISAPADTVTGTNLVRFAWAASSDPDQSDPPSSLVYDLECTLTDFGQADLKRITSAPGAGELSVELEDNRLWTYRLRARDDEGAVSEWSVPRRVLVNIAEDPPLSFDLLTPEDNSPVAELDSLTFTWQATSDPDWGSSVTYRLELTAQGGQTQTFTCPTPEFTYLGGLVNETNYTWRVIAIDNLGLTTRCAADFHFRTSTTPSVPEIADLPAELMPPDPLVFKGARDPNPRDVLTYTLQVAAEPEFRSLAAAQSGVPHTGDRIALPVETLPGQEHLQDDVDYYFRVQATDNHGYSSPFSEPHKFRFNRVNDAPEAVPATHTPRADSEIHTQTPEFTWAPSRDEDLSDPPESLVYDLRLTAGDPAAGAPVEFASAPGSVRATPPQPLRDNTIWAWQVRARDNDGAVSDWSSPVSFLINVAEDPPSPPALVKPRPGETMNYLGPITFEWNKSVDPDYRSSVRYTLEFATTQDFAAAQTVPDLDVTVYTHPWSLENTTYYWRVTATDNTGLTTPSEVQSFTLDTRPSVPEPLLPKEMFELTPNDRLAWTQSIDPNPNDKITYEFQFAADLGDRQMEVAESEGTQANAISLSMADMLGDNQVFIFRVRAVDEHGVASEWSRPARFFYNLKNDPPGPVGEPLEPADGREVTSVRLNWRPAADPDFSDPPESLTYRVDLSTDPGFTGEFISLTTGPGVTTASPTNLRDNSRWFWRVSAADNDGASGPYSAVRSFTLNTTNDPPAAFHLVSPGDGAEVAAADLRLVWEATQDPDPADRVTYAVTVAADPAFTTGVREFKNLSDPFLQLPPELASPGRQVYWRVSATDGKGAVVWGSDSHRTPWRFTVRASTGQ